MQRNCFFYVISPGNNSKAIQSALEKRKCWYPLPNNKQILSANFFWKQNNYSSKIYAQFQDLLRCLPDKKVILNHFQNNFLITNKSNLIRNIKFYYTHQKQKIDHHSHIFNSIPTAFIITAHIEDLEYKDFLEKFEQIQSKKFFREKIPAKHCEHNIWFIKPQSDNQGKGIIISSNLKEIQNFLLLKPINSKWIIQKAIEKPLLYHGRKFDIRVWVLITCQFEVYFYDSPYLKTSSKKYHPNCTGLDMQLTNNFQQKKLDDYSKFQEGNCVSFEQFKNYLKTSEQGQHLIDKILNRMKELVLDTFLSVRKTLSKGTKKKQFQLFGYDFLIDEDYNTWLIQVNNNPYLGTPNFNMRTMVPLMIDEMLEIMVDPIFPHQNYTPVEKKSFILIYRQTYNFRSNSIKVNHSLSDTKNNKTNFKLPHQSCESIYKLNATMINSKNILNDTPKIKIYDPSDTLKSLLNTYCYIDTKPFRIPVTLILKQKKLINLELLKNNLQTLKMITHSRICQLMLDSNILPLCMNIVYSPNFHLKIRIQILSGFTNAAKGIKNKIYIIKTIIPQLAQWLKKQENQIQTELIQSIIKLVVNVGGVLERTHFIPGFSRESEMLRSYFIRSNTLRFLLYLHQKYKDLCQIEITNFLNNMSKKDWNLYNSSFSQNLVQLSRNNTKQKQDSYFYINTSMIDDQKPRVICSSQFKSIRKQLNDKTAEKIFSQLLK